MPRKKSIGNNNSPKIDIYVLYEKTSNIEQTLQKLANKFDNFCARHNALVANFESRFGILEERTATLKYFVYGALLGSIIAVIGVLINLVG